MKRVGNILSKISLVLSLLVLGVMLFILGAHVVEGFDASYILTNKEIMAGITLFFFLIGTLIGIWKKLLGAGLSIAAYIAFIFIEDQIVFNVIFGTVLLIAILNLLHCVLSKIYFEKV